MTWRRKVASYTSPGVMTCYAPGEARLGLAGLPQLKRENAAICKGDSSRTWHTPRFLMLGFAKCGSSALHQHPQIKRHPNAKETHVFDALPLLLANGVPLSDRAWLTEGFESDPTRGFRERLPNNLALDEICGDGTPWYASYADALRIVSRVQRWAPAASFIVTLRNPVRAWWSLACMFQRDALMQGRNFSAGTMFDADVLGLPMGASIAQGCARRRERYMDWYGRSMPIEILWAYAERLRTWRAGFAKHRFLLLRSDTISSKGTLDRVWRFLGLRALRDDRIAQPQATNVASEGDSGKLRCALEFTHAGEPRKGAPSSTPSAEAVLDALLIFFGPEVLARGSNNASRSNPWPEAQVDALLSDGWVDEAFIEPWRQDALRLAAHARSGSMRSVCKASPGV